MLREVVANAVVHREYDAQFLGESVTVDIYPDRVEVSNPGGLWGGVTLATIGSGVSCCRNATLMQLLHQIPYDDANDVTVEGGGSGIPLVIREMKSHALGEPVFRATPIGSRSFLDATAWSSRRTVTGLIMWASP